MGVGSLREAGEKRVGDGIPKGGGGGELGEIGNKFCSIAFFFFAIEKAHRGRNREYKLREAGNSDSLSPHPSPLNRSHW